MPGPSCPAQPEGPEARAQIQIWVETSWWKAEGRGGMEPVHPHPALPTRDPEPLQGAADHGAWGALGRVPDVIVTLQSAEGGRCPARKDLTLALQECDHGNALASLVSPAQTPKQLACGELLAAAPVSPGARWHFGSGPGMMPEKGLSAGEPGEPGEERLGLELGSMLGPGDLETPLAAGSATPGLSSVPFSPPAGPSVVTVMLLCANEALLVSFTETLQLLGAGARCDRLSGTEGEGETGSERSPRNSRRVAGGELAGG